MKIVASKFLYSKLNNKKFILQKELKLAIDERIVTIPKKFPWNGAAGPQWLRNFLGIDAKIGTCAHDYLYSDNRLYKDGSEYFLSRKECDIIFYSILVKVDKVDKYRAGIAYLGVRLLGKSRFRGKNV